LIDLRTYKSKVKDAQLSIQIRKVEVQYDYFDDYAIKVSVDEIQKHPQKLSHILYHPTINNLSIEFTKNNTEQVPTRVFTLNTVTTVQKYALINK